MSNADQMSTYLGGSLLTSNDKMHSKWLAQCLLHNEPSEQSPIIRHQEKITHREHELANAKC